MMNPLPEGLTGDVDAAHCRKFLLCPAQQSAVQDRDIFVTEFSEALRRERCPTFTFVVNDNGNPPVRHQFGDAKFDLAPRQRDRVSNLTSVELASLPDVEHGVQSFRSHQSGEIAARYLVRHGEDFLLSRLSLTYPWFCSTNASRKCNSPKSHPTRNQCKVLKNAFTVCSFRTSLRSTTPAPWILKASSA